ncbi:MAG: P-loop NTPase [bacterium]|nr:P-loop NTPase [bacterium]
MIKDVKVEGGVVSFTVELTTPACPLKAKIEADCREAVGRVEGVEKIDINMTASATARGAAPETEGIPGVKNIFAVSSGKGGVGKSTVAVNLALALAKTGAKVGLMDADPYGPNIPQMVGCSEPPQVANNRVIPPSVNGLKTISVGLIDTGDTPVVWRGPMVHSLIQQFLRDVDWGELDYLVVDMPPGTGDAQLSLSKLVPLAGAVMVTTPQQVSQSDVRRAIQMFRKVEVPVLGVVENMAYFICPDNGKRYNIFGEGGGERLAEEYEVPFLARVPIDQRIASGGDAGQPIVAAEPDCELSQSFMALAGAVAQQISIANAASQPLPVIQ